MRKRTTTQQLSTAITNNLLQITKAECHYKSSNRIDEINQETFKENLQFLCESGCFADAIGWHYERDIKTNGYIAECGRNNRNSEIIITVHLSACNGVSEENVERTLLFWEEQINDNY